MQQCESCERKVVKRYPVYPNSWDKERAAFLLCITCIVPIWWYLGKELT